MDAASGLVFPAFGFSVPDELLSRAVDAGGVTPGTKRLGAGCSERPQTEMTHNLMRHGKAY